MLSFHSKRQLRKQINVISTSFVILLGTTQVFQVLQDSFISQLICLIPLTFCLGALFRGLGQIRSKLELLTDKPLLTTFKANQTLLMMQALSLTLCCIGFVTAVVSTKYAKAQVVGLNSASQRFFTLWSTPVYAWALGHASLLVFSTFMLYVLIKTALSTRT